MIRLRDFGLNFEVDTPRSTIVSSLRSRIKDLSHNVKVLHKKYNLTESQYLEDTFQRKRSRFFRCIQGDITSHSEIRRILDSNTGKVVNDKNSVYRVLKQETSKILRKPTPLPPNNKSVWFDNLYSQDSRIRDLVPKGFSWESLSKDFELREILDVVCCRPKSVAGFDQVSESI